MNLKSISKSILLLLMSMIITAGMAGISGCSDDDGTTNPPPVTDTSKVVVYKGVAAFYWFKGTNDTSYMGVDLWAGDSVRQISTSKDMELIDNINDTTNFYFRSGDLSQVLIGFKTRFNRIYANARDSAFDTLTVIPDSNNLLDSLDFVWDDTYGVGGAWGYFTIDQPQKPIYSFYLAGKYANGTTTNRVYGVFQIKSVLKVYAPIPPPDGSFGVMVTLDIKYNKNGVNYFKH